MSSGICRSVSVAVVMGFLATQASAQSATAVALDLPVQALSESLCAVGKRTDINILVDLKMVRGLRAPVLRGDMTADEAIGRLLTGTGLKHKFIDEHTVVLSIENRADAGNAPTSWSVVRLAAVDSPEGRNNRENSHPGTEGSQETSSSQNKTDGASPVAGDAGLEEIVVTAQKRQERLRDVPISMSVLRGVDLDKSTATDATEALSRVPGISFQQDIVGGVTQVAVRGVLASNTFNSGAATTAFYLDALPFSFAKSSFTPNPDTYDLDRIEVLRGPQGTLYGAAALNGVVRILTQDANPNQFELKARTSASTTKGGAENYRGDLAVNVPIVDGKLAARAVVGFQDASGWIDRPNHQDANDTERLNLRLKINAQPTEALSIGASAWYSREDYGSPPTGDDTGRNLTLVDEPATTDFDAYSLKIGYEFSWAALTSATSYIDYKNFATLDLAYSGSPVLDEIRVDANTFAEEVLLNSRHGGSWRWSLGGMYRDSKDRMGESTAPLPPTPAIAQNTSKSYAMFGELTRLFLDGRLELTGGLRYFKDDVGLREESSFLGTPPDQLIKADRTFTATTPRAVLTWHPKEQATVYASYSEGFRSGAFQLPTVLLVAPFPPLEPDRLKNYEIGTKGSLLGGRLNFETALYYMDWQDVQERSVVFFQNGFFNALNNAPSASGLGIDFGVTARPVDALELGVNVSWNDLTFDNQVLSRGIVQYDKGDRPSLSPEYTAGLFADYAFPLGSSGFEGMFSVSANYTSETDERRVRGLQRFVSENDAILIGRTSVSIRAPNHWITTLFVDNLNNEKGSPRIGNNAAFPQFAMRVRPRTIGVQLEYRF